MRGKLILKNGALAALLGGVVLGVSPVKAQDASPCAAVLCLKGKMLGGDGGPACQASIQAYFAIAIYDYSGFDAPATSAARMIYLEAGCPTELLGQKEAVNARYGTQEFPPS